MGSMALRAASNEAFRAKVRARHKSVHRSTARCGNECQANSIPCRLCTVRISVFRQFRPCSCDWSASPVRPSAAFRRRSIRPYKITSTWTDGRTTTEFTEIQPNANLPATRFAKPLRRDRYGLQRVSHAFFVAEMRRVAFLRQFPESGRSTTH